MATLLKCGGLFLHIPQTGGDWIAEVLEQSGLVFAHVGAQCAAAGDLEPLERLLQAPEANGKSNRPLFKFCFVRHPQRWYEAYYRTAQSGQTFDQFMEQTLRERPGYLSALYESYTRDAHFVGRFERLADDLEIVTTLLRQSIPAEVRQTFPVPAAEPELKLDWSLQQQLEETDRQAYTRYGYATTDAPATPALTPFSPSVLLKGPFAREKGFAWRIDVAELSRFADAADYPRRSMISLLENGMPLRFAHAEHDDIRSLGGGRFSHWEDAILFSTSDNSDPNDTGRRYDLAWVFPAPAGATDLLMRAPAQATAALVAERAA